MDWVRVSKSKPCCICGKPDWCLSHQSGDIAICARISDGCVKWLGDAGYLHRIRQSLERYTPPVSRRMRPPRAAPKRTPQEWSLWLSKHKATEFHIRFQAERLGVTPESLKRLDLGFRNGAALFPMRNEDRRLIGVRVRAQDGSKWSIKGSKNGLFIPIYTKVGEHLWICEGPTDTAALLGLDLTVIGRPSCNGGVDMIVAFVRKNEHGQVTIIADSDGPGYEGARNLADQLWGKTKLLQIVFPPTKDIRDWLASGGTGEKLLQRQRRALSYNPIGWRRAMRDRSPVRIK